MKRLSYERQCMMNCMPDSVSNIQNLYIILTLGQERNPQVIIQ